MFPVKLKWIFKASLIVVMMSTVIDAFADDVHRRIARQVYDAGNDVIIKDWWLIALYKIFPALFRTENSVPTPTMFLPYTDQVVTRILKAIFGWWPTIAYEDKG